MKLSKILMTLTAGAALCLGANQVFAQGGGFGGPGGGGGGGGFRGMDPQEMQQMIMDGIKQQMGVTNDEEWHVIQDRLQKVIDTQRDTMGGGMNFRRLMGRNGGGGGGGNFGGGGGAWPAGRRHVWWRQSHARTRSVE